MATVAPLYLVDMALPGSSFNCISKWAKRNFADSYEQLPGARAFTFHQYVAPQYIKTGYVNALVIGTTNNEKLVAWLEKSRMQLGYAIKKASGTYEIRLKMFADEGLRFDEPFHWVIWTKDEHAGAQLEALVRYCFLMKGTTAAVKDNLLDFEAHFPGACSSVASGNAKKTRKRILKEEALKMKETKSSNTNMCKSRCSLCFCLRLT